MINYPFASPRPEVPYQFPQFSWIKLQDYITTLVNQYGGVYWPLDDAASNPYNRVINPAVAVGRELVINGGFDTDTIWSKGTGWTISGGAAHASAAPTGQNIGQSIPFTIGKAYTITYTISNYSAGNVRFTYGGTVGTTRSANGTYTETILNTTSGTLTIVPVSVALTADIDNVSVKELNIPASTATPAQLLNTDVWNNGGVAAWTVTNSATLSAISVARHDGATGTVLKVAYNGVANPIAKQSPLVIGNVYRVYGWVAKTSTATSNSTPRITHNGVTVVLFGGANSTDWQPFDVVFVATATDIDFGMNGGSAGSEVMYDVTVVAMDTGVRQESNLVLNGNFSVGTNWTLPSGWAITGGQLVATAATSGTAPIQAGVPCVGKTYLVTYDLVVTSGTVRVRLNGTAGTTQSVSGTYSEVIIAATASDINFNPVATFTGTIDNVVIMEISPFAARPVNGVVLGNAESNRLLVSASFDGVNDVINLYSAQLNSIFPPFEGTFSAFFEVSASGQWTDGVQHYIAHFQADATNRIIVSKSATNNTMNFSYGTVSVKSTTSTAVGGNVGWIHIAVTWSVSANQAMLYLNGVQVGSIITTIGTWVGNLVSTNSTFGAQSSGGASPWSGRLTQPVLLGHALSASEIAEIAKLGDAS